MEILTIWTIKNFYKSVSMSIDKQTVKMLWDSQTGQMSIDMLSVQKMDIKS